MATDLFGKTPGSIETPITADHCTILWDDGDGPVADAIQFSLEYNQSITRRRTIGSQNAIIYGSQPSGRATMARLITTAGSDTSGDSWTCTTGQLTFILGSCEGETGGDTYVADGCIVTSFSITAQAEDTTVMDNVVIEFLSLSKQDGGGD